MDKCFLSSFPEIPRHVTLWSTAAGSTISQGCHVVTNITFYSSLSEKSTGLLQGREDKISHLSPLAQAVQFRVHIPHRAKLTPYCLSPGTNAYTGCMWTNAFKAYSDINQN